MSVLKKYKEFQEEYNNRVEDLLWSSLKEEMEVIQNLHDISVDLQDEGHRIQMWLTLKSNGVGTPRNSVYIRFDNDLKYHIDANDKARRKEDIIEMIDRYDQVEISIDPIDVPIISMERYVEIRNDIIKRVESLYPFVNVVPLKIERGLTVPPLPLDDLPSIKFSMKKSDLKS